MSTITHAIATSSTANSATYNSGSFTPLLDDLLIVLVTASGTTTDAATLTSSVGTTFSRIVTGLKNASADRLYAFVANSKSTATAQTVTFSCTGDAATGAIIQVVRVGDIGKVGLSAIRQFAKLDNQLAGNAPSVTFSSPTLNSNIIIGLVGNSTNPATITQPSTGGWGEGNDTGYNTPATGAEYTYKVTGFVGTTVTWASTSGTAFGTIGLEIDTSLSFSSNKTIANITGSATGTAVTEAVVVTWLEIELTELTTLGTSNKTIASITGNAGGTHQNLFVSWLEIEAGASTNGTSNKTIANISGSSSVITYIAGSSNKTIGSLTGSTNADILISGTSNKTIGSLGGSASGSNAIKNVVLTWIEIEPTTLSTGTSNKTISSISGSASGIHQNLFLSWLEIESGYVNIGSSNKIIPFTGSASGSSPLILTTGNSSKVFASISGSATGEHVKITVSWLKIDTTLANSGSSSSTFSFTGSSAGTNNLPTRTGTSSKVFTGISGSATGEKTYTVISWIKVEDTPTTIGTSSKILGSIGGSASSISMPPRIGTSNKIIASLSRTSTGKVLVKGTSNKAFSFISSNTIPYETSLRYYYSPNRTTVFLPASRTSVFLANERNTVFESEERTSVFVSDSRTNIFSTPNRIGT